MDPHPHSRRRFLAGAAAAAAGGVVGAAQLAGGVRSLLPGVITAGGGARASQPAIRVNPPTTTTTLVPPPPDGKLMFPLVTTPVPGMPGPTCYVLDNFGDCRGINCSRRHQGVDIMSTNGQWIVAVVDGYVSRLVEDHVSAGNYLNVTEGAAPGTGAHYFSYQHLSAFVVGIAEGSLVRRGDVIGYVGDTGNPGAGNYHLHFEVHPNGGSAVDPLRNTAGLVLDVPRACTVW